MEIIEAIKQNKDFLKKLIELKKRGKFIFFEISDLAYLFVTATEYAPFFAHKKAREVENWYRKLLETYNDVIFQIRLFTPSIGKRRELIVMFQDGAPCFYLLTYDREKFVFEPFENGKKEFQIEVNKKEKEDKNGM